MLEYPLIFSSSGKGIVKPMGKRVIKIEVAVVPPPTAT